MWGYGQREKLEKSSGLEEDGALTWRHAAFEATHAPGVRCSVHFLIWVRGKESVGLEPGSPRDVRTRVSTQGSAHLHVLGGGWEDRERAVNIE